MMMMMMMMRRRRSEGSVAPLIMVVAAAVGVAVLSSWFPGGAEAATGLQPPVKLKLRYYKVTNSCRDAEAFVRHQVGIYWSKDKTLTAKLLRLLYSDCFVTGCDASILLDGGNSEKSAPQNSGFGEYVFEVIDKIKTVMEAYCPGVVSCSDILNLATRDAVKLAGGPSYVLYTGRRDGTSSTASSVDLPSPSISLAAAESYFNSRGLDTLDMATLLGGHMMGQTHCNYITDRLYNFNKTGKPDPSLSKSLLSDLRKQCKGSTTNPDTDPTVSLNGGSIGFTNSYYSRVLSRQAVLGVDQQLLNGANTTQIAREFASDIKDYKKSFALSINRMGNINVLTGKQGEIRQYCRCTNSNMNNCRR